MSLRSAYLTAIACLLSAYAFAASSAGDAPPRELASIGDIRSWVEANKGFGVPQSAEFTLAGSHVFVVWNSPFSGPASNYAYSYRERARDHRWELLDFSFFPQPEFMSYAYLDGRNEKLVYISAGGKTLKTVAVKAR